MCVPVSTCVCMYVCVRPCMCMLCHIASSGYSLPPSETPSIMAELKTKLARLHNEVQAAESSGTRTLKFSPQNLIRATLCYSPCPFCKMGNSLCTDCLQVISRAGIVPNITDPAQDTCHHISPGDIWLQKFFCCIERTVSVYVYADSV